jgi:hypothetical protein
MCSEADLRTDKEYKFISNASYDVCPIRNALPARWVMRLLKRQSIREENARIKWSLRFGVLLHSPRHLAFVLFPSKNVPEIAN